MGLKWRLTSVAEQKAPIAKPGRVWLLNTSTVQAVSPDQGKITQNR